VLSPFIALLLWGYCQYLNRATSLAPVLPTAPLQTPPLSLPRLPFRQDGRLSTGPLQPARWLRETEQLASLGLRVLAIAERRLAPGRFPVPRSPDTLAPAGAAPAAAGSSAGAQEPAGPVGEAAPPSPPAPPSPVPPAFAEADFDGRSPTNNVGATTSGTLDARPSGSGAAARALSSGTGETALPPLPPTASSAPTSAAPSLSAPATIASGASTFWPPATPSASPPGIGSALSPAASSPLSPSGATSGSPTDVLPPAGRESLASPALQEPAPSPPSPAAPKTLSDRRAFVHASAGLPHAAQGAVSASAPASLATAPSAAGAGASTPNAGTGTHAAVPPVTPPSACGGTPVRRKGRSEARLWHLLSPVGSATATGAPAVAPVRAEAGPPPSGVSGGSAPSDGRHGDSDGGAAAGTGASEASGSNNVTGPQPLPASPTRDESRSATDEAAAGSISGGEAVAATDGDGAGEVASIVSASPATPTGGDAGNADASSKATPPPPVPSSQPPPSSHDSTASTAVTNGSGATKGETVHGGRAGGAAPLSFDEVADGLVLIGVVGIFDPPRTVRL